MRKGLGSGMCQQEAAAQAAFIVQPAAGPAQRTPGSSIQSDVRQWDDWRVWLSILHWLSGCSGNSIFGGICDCRSVHLHVRARH
jgi:hypothetical protein